MIINNMNIETLLKYRQSYKNILNNDIYKPKQWDYNSDLILLKSIKDKRTYSDISTILDTQPVDIKNRLNYLIELIGMEKNIFYTNRLLNLEKNPNKDVSLVNNLEILTQEHLILASSKGGGYKAKQLQLLGLKWPPKKGWKNTIIGKMYKPETIKTFVEFNRENTNNNISQLIDKNVKNINDKPIHYYVYTDGACSRNGSKYSKAGFGIYFQENDPRNMSQKLEGRQTNNTSELIALIEVYPIIKIDLDKGFKIGLVSDSQYAINCCTSYGEKCEKINWRNNKKEIPNIELIKKAYTIYKNKDNIEFIHIAAHTGLKDKHSLGNENADRLANQAIGVNDCPFLKKRSEVKKIYFYVPFNRKNEIKQYGGKWDSNLKKWYSYNNNNDLDKIILLFKTI
jgi:ribonuclease HI